MECHYFEIRLTTFSKYKHIRWDALNCLLLRVALGLNQGGAGADSVLASELNPGGAGAG